MLGELSRILKPNGVFVLITYGQPKTRLHYLCKDKYKWDVEQRTVGKDILALFLAAGHLKPLSMMVQLRQLLESMRNLTSTTSTYVEKSKLEGETREEFTPFFLPYCNTSSAEASHKKCTAHIF